MTVTDTGPLLVLAKLNQLELLLRLYGHVIVPEAVFQEAVLVGRRRGYPDAHALDVFLQRMGWSPTACPEIAPQLVQERLGSGEKQAISLALDNRSLLLIDDQHARRVAKNLGVQTLGSLGVLVSAYRRQLVTGDELDILLSTIIQRKDIWIDPEVCHRVRRALLT